MSALVKLSSSNVMVTFAMKSSLTDDWFLRNFKKLAWYKHCYSNICYQRIILNEALDSIDVFDNA